MELLQAIKQNKPFSSEQEKVAVNVLFTHNYLRSNLNSFLRDLGLTNSQYNSLRILNGAKGPISTAELRERMIEPMSDTSRLVERLVKKDLVSKKTCPADLRKVDVVITPDGRNLLRKIESPLLKMLNAKINLNEKESRQLNELLDKLRID